MPNCGAKTKRGKHCREPVDVWPCRYHNAIGYRGVLRLVQAGTLLPCECGEWMRAGVDHTCDPARRPPG